MTASNPVLWQIYILEPGFNHQEVRGSAKPCSVPTVHSNVGATSGWCRSGPSLVPFQRVAAHITTLRSVCTVRNRWDERRKIWEKKEGAEVGTGTGKKLPGGQLRSQCPSPVFPLLGAGFTLRGTTTHSFMLSPVDSGSVIVISALQQTFLAVFLPDTRKNYISLPPLK